jgi:hypothetical protein
MTTSRIAVADIENVDSVIVGTSTRLLMKSQVVMDLEVRRGFVGASQAGKRFVA